MLKQGLDEVILKKMGLPIGKQPELGAWREFLDRRKKATKVVKIALVGKYGLQDAYKSILESLAHAGTYNDRKVETVFVSSEDINKENVEVKLEVFSGIVIGPGFGQRGINGKLIAAEYARTHNKPTFGICLGMQMMVVEFARNVLGFKDADSSEMNPDTSHNVIDMMEEQKNMEAHRLAHHTHTTFRNYEIFVKRNRNSKHE